MADESKPKFELEIADLPASSLSFSSFHVEERLSECYRVEVTALCPRVDPHALLGRKAALYVRFEGHPERCFHGIVWSAALTPKDERVFQLEVQIVPRLFQLSLGRDSRNGTAEGAFRDITVIETVKRVLKAAKLTFHDDDFPATEGPKHEVITQYDESDYDFIRRLLYEEGISFSIQNDAEQERPIFFDDQSSLLAVDGLEALIDRRRKDIRFDGVFNVREFHATAPDAVMLRDYDLKNPSRTPEARKPDDDSSDASREVYDHPGGHLELGTRAERMLQRLTMQTRTLQASCYWPHLEPGRYLQLHSELRAALTSELLVIAVEHEGHIEDKSTRAAYENRFIAIPKGTPHRPTHAPQPPRTYGAQRAFVTGPRGQELHGDDFGRITVRFPWDRSGITDDRSSGHLRVGQPPLSGSMVMPRVGFEVLIGHELGDIDRPYVNGHLYNEESRFPYGPDRMHTSSLQSATTDGGGGANELRFGDSGGSEEMMLNASHDMSTRVENTMVWNVAKDETLKVGSNSTLSVKADATSNVGGARVESVTAMQNVNVGGDAGDGVTGNQKVSVGATRSATVGGDQVENVTGTLKRVIAAMQNVLVIAGYTRKIVGSSSVSVGAAWAETVAKSKSTSVTGAMVEGVGALKSISAKDVNISTGAVYAEKVKSQSVHTKKDRADTAQGKLAVESKGSMTVEADNISFTADDELTFTAGKVSFTLKKGGEIEIKAKKITIKNSEALKQAMHKTN